MGAVEEHEFFMGTFECLEEFFCVAIVDHFVIPRCQKHYSSVCVFVYVLNYV